MSERLHERVCILAQILYRELLFFKEKLPYGSFFNQHRYIHQ